jgi:Ca2+-binding RTX toxin-like protein
LEPRAGRGDAVTTTARVVLLGLLLAVGAAALGVVTASNVVPSTSVGRQRFTIDANALKPAECAALNLTHLVVGTTGTAADDLILGPATASTFTGNGGRDCMVGGARKDTFNGNGNRAGDVCIGNGGNDTFKKCQTTYQ